MKYDGYVQEARVQSREMVQWVKYLQVQDSRHPCKSWRQMSMCNLCCSTERWEACMYVYVCRQNTDPHKIEINTSLKVKVNKE